MVSPKSDACGGFRCGGGVRVCVGEGGSKR